MSASNRRERFRQILTSPTCVHPADVFDPMSARIAADLGFSCGMFAGSVASMTVLAAPDIVMLTLTEFADQLRRVCRASELPMMCDADHGYGNALNVMRTVTELETAGVCAITIEDTLLPAPYGDATGKGLISIDEGVGKMRAALAARRDPSLIIVGRTSALGVSTIEDTIARVSAYEKTGVDAIFLAGATTREQIDALSKDRKLPLFLGGVPAPMLDQDYLTSRGVKLCLLGHNAYMASVNAIHATMKAIREGTKPQDLKGLASGDLIKRATRREDYERWAKDYLGA